MTAKTKPVQYKVVHSVLDEWHVEGIDYERGGVVYVTTFPGTDAEARAREYARFKNTP